MPAPTRDLIIRPEKVRYQVAYEPVINALHSMLLLLRVDELSGLDEWIVKTAGAMPQKVMDQHAVIMWGLHYALLPRRRYESFPAYLDHLETVDPVELREHLLEKYLQYPLLEGADSTTADLTADDIQEDVETYLAFLRARFQPELISEKVERQAFKMLRDPEKMRGAIVAHLGMMWDEYFEAEFQRRQPLIQETLEAFSDVDFEGMDDEEAVRFITGQWNEKLCDYFDEHESIVFVPSPHTGPYSGPLMTDDTLWLMFNCRLPYGSPLGLSKLSRAELLVWLSALADDTRLHILALLKENDELCAQDIISMLDTSQSTASRHLRQLSASGFIREHRTEAGKCYRLNSERLEDTMRALETFIQ